mmetsp:Transcript_39591/g.61845  ORF Transcript_39591/g.61845 Transcript_39591/m.61845 type:complete len:190 (+) Transcript_39591:76-645(+)
MAKHELEHEWSIWEHRAASGGGNKAAQDWSQNMQELCSFSTAEGFWRYFNHIPRPSEVFFDGQTKKKVGDRQVESLSIFKKGISPEWEDPANQSGGEWTCRKNLDPNVLNTYWENLVLGLIGETIDDADEICGARVVDKSKGDRPIYRLELWVRGKDRKTADKLRDKMIEVMGEEVNPRIMPEFTFKGH